MIINYQNFSLSLFDNRYQNASHIHIHTIKNLHNISTIYRPLGSSRAGALSKNLNSSRKSHPAQRQHRPTTNLSFI
nr:MAG TPA: hypothetical protein [Caudoviricetes sp.]